MPVEDLLKEIRTKSVKNVKETLKKEKANVKYVDSKNKSLFYSPLHAAVKTGSPAIVDVLLEAGADVAALDSDGDTALHAAAALPDSADTVAIVGALIKKKAKVESLNGSKSNALHVAAEKGSVGVMNVLCAEAGDGVESCAPGYTPLLAAVKAGHMGVVDALVVSGAKLGTKDAEGLTPLLHLVSMGRNKDAAALLEKGDCDVDAVDSRGLSALMIACGCGAKEGEARKAPDMELVTALLKKEASPDMQAGPGKNTPIMDAIIAKDIALAKALLEGSKKVNIKNSKKESALSLASALGDDDLIAAVLAAGADVSVDGPNMIKKAMEDKKDVLVKELVLLLKPLQLENMDLDFKKLLEENLPQSALAHLQRFDEDQADNHAVDDDGNTNLHVAAQLGATYEVCVSLQKMGLNPNKANKAGDTPLHVAAKAGNVEACKALLDGGANAIARNLKNKTPRSQPKIPECTKDFLLDAEEDAKHNKGLKSAAIWDEKMRATQSDNACIIRGL